VFLRSLRHDSLVRTGRHANQTTVTEAAVDERWFTGIYGDDSLDLAGFPRQAFAAGLALAVVYARNLEWEWVIEHGGGSTLIYAVTGRSL
jgi:hypothetical protein